MIYFLMYMFLIGLTSCGIEETTVDRRTTEVVTQTETVTEIVESDPEVIEEIIEVETVIEVPVSEPLIYVGSFCGRVVVAHGSTYYLAYSGLLPLLPKQKVKISNSCSISVDKANVIREKKS